MSKRIGVLGGAFDPVHLGHLILASEAKQQLKLDLVLFVPTFRSPHRHKTIGTAFAHRAAMVRRAIRGQRDFSLTSIETRVTGRSYTVKTLELLRTEYRGAALVFIMGADSLEQIGSWREPERLFSLATFAVARRRGHRLESPLPKAGIVHIDMPQIDISATEIRRRVREGLPIRFLVPAAVEKYIRENGLYRE